jgi:hypothetical protein
MALGFSAITITYDMRKVIVIYPSTKQDSHTLNYPAPGPGTEFKVSHFSLAM